MVHRPFSDLRIRHGAHEAQMFDTAVSRAAAVTAFIHEGFARREQILVVILSGHWRMVRERLDALGHDVERATAEGRMTMLEARSTLKQCLRAGVPDAARLGGLFTPLLDRHSAAGTGLRIYGELSDLLADTGDFTGARLMEDLSNQLRLRWPCTLFCGYSAANFGDPKNNAGLRLICRAHDQMHAAAADPLGAWLVAADGGHRS